MSRAEEFPHALAVLQGAGRVFWLRALAWSSAIALATGIPTVLIPNSLFSRTIPTSPWQYVVWAAIALVGGLTMAARKLPGEACSVERRTVAGSGLAYLAVACPVCNKIVISLIGVSGALTYFAPLQPVLGAGALALMLLALRRALRAASPTVAVAAVTPRWGP